MLGSLRFSSSVHSGGLHHPLLAIGAFASFALVLVPTAVSQSDLDARIRRELQFIERNPQANNSPLTVGRVWAQIAYDYQDEGAFASAEAAYVKSLAELRDVAEATSEYATILDNFGSLYLMTGRLQEAENCRKKSLEMRKQSGDPLDIERSRAHLAEVALARHKWKDAEKQASEAAQEMILLNDKQKTDVISALITESYAQSLEGKQQDAVLSAKQAVAIASDSFPLQSLPVAQAYLVLAIVQLKAGSVEEAGNSLRHSIPNIRELTAPGDPQRTVALTIYKGYLLRSHQPHEADKVDNELRSNTQQRDSQCKDCTVSVYGLARDSH